VCVVVVLQFAGGAVLLVLGVLFSIAAPGIGEDVAARRKSVWGDGLLGRSQAAGSGMQGYLLGGGLIVVAVVLWSIALIHVLKS